MEKLIASQEEQVNHSMLKHAIYDVSALLRLAIGFCLADYKLDIAIKIIKILFKVRMGAGLEHEELNYLELLLAFTFLRLNQ